MLVKEFRVVLPLTVEEYQVAQLYSVAEASKNETGGGEGIEVLKNEPFDNYPLLGDKYSKGQYTYKIYHLKSKVPSFIRLLAPEGSLEIHEEAWNAYPYCRTIISNPGYMKESFYITIETLHAADDGESENNPGYMKKNFMISVETLHVADMGTMENAHRLKGEKLKIREVVTIDIANDPVKSSDYKPNEDPTKFQSDKTGRGPLQGPQWWKKLKSKFDSQGIESTAVLRQILEREDVGFQCYLPTRRHIQCDPVMTCYKLVTCEFKWFGLQARIEKFIQDSERRLFTNFHRQVFCWMDEWHGMTMDDIRQLEDKTKEELDQQRQKGEVRGTMDE